MKRRVFFIVLAIASVSLSACMQSPDCFREDVFCASVVTNTAGIRDRGLNQNTWEGLQESKTEGTADRVAFIESIDARDYAKNIDTFAQDGYDVIVTIGPAMDDETLRAADLYPDSVFIGMDQPQKETRPNLLVVTFPEDQMGFWAGALAARITETGTVGAVCETSSIDAMRRYCEGFRKGAVYTDEDVNALVVYRSDESSEKLFVDSEWGHASAMDLIQRGADVIFAAGGGTGQGALIAAAEAGVTAIGAEQDQAQVLTEAQPAVITSVYRRADLEVRKWMRSIGEGNAVEAESIGTFGYAAYREVKIPIPNSIKTEMDQLLVDLSTGTLKTEVPQHTP